jgi:hypothetical protein
MENTLFTARDTARSGAAAASRPRRPLSSLGVDESGLRGKNQESQVRCTGAMSYRSVGSAERFGARWHDPCSIPRPEWRSPWGSGLSTGLHTW